MELKPGYKQTEVGEIPEDWEVLKFTEITNLITCGLAATPNYVDQGKGYPFLSSTNVKNGRIRWSNYKFISAQLHKKLYRNNPPLKGDILYSRVGTIGEAGVIEKDIEFSIYVSLTLIKPKVNFSSYFLMQLLNSESYKKRAKDQVYLGGGVGNLNVDVVREYPIPIPPSKAEQEAIAGALSDADELIASLEKLIEKKRMIKQGAMQELLTGKKRLPGFSEKWESIIVEDVISSFFCGPSPTCLERNIIGDTEWGVLKTTAITWENGWDWKKHKTLPKSYWDQPNLEVRHGDVLVTKAGPRHRVGVAVWVNTNPQRIIASGKMICLRPNLDKVVPLMLAAAISEKESQNFINQRTTGMAEAQVNFENSVLLNTPIKIPAKAEQEAIASVLSDMDAGINALEEKLEKAREIKAGMMHNLLTGTIRLV